MFQPKTMRRRKMEIAEIQVYVYRKSQWIKTNTFGPNDLICWLNPERTEIWVWKGPLVSETEQNLGEKNLFQWKDHKLGYTFHSCQFSTDTWKKPKKLAKLCDLPEEEIQLVSEKYTPQVQIPRKIIRTIEWLNWLTVIMILAIGVLTMPVSIRNPETNGFEFVYPSKAVFLLRWQIIIAVSIGLIGIISMQLVFSHQYRFKPAYWYTWIQLGALSSLTFIYWIVKIPQVLDAQNYTIGPINQIVVHTIIYRNLLMVTSGVVLSILVLNLLNISKSIKILRNFPTESRKKSLGDI